MNSLFYRILCVDDDKMILDLYSSIFRTLKSQFGQEPQIKEKTFETTTCTNGNDAIKAVRTAIISDQPYSIAFIDINMPGGKDGYETAKEIRTIDKSIEIVIVTGEGIGEVTRKLNMVSQEHKLFFLRKPFQMQEFRQLAVTLAEKWEYHTLTIELINKLEHKIQKTHLELETVKDNYREIIENAKDLIQIINIDGSFEFVNPAWEQALNYTQSDREKINFYQILVTSEIDKVKQAVHDLQQGRTVNTMETCLKSKSGNLVFVEANIVPRKSEESYIGASFFFRDITYKKNIEQALHLSEQNLREVFPRIIKSLSSTVEIRDVYTAGHQTRVANLAQQIAQIMNLPNDEIEGIYIAGLLHDIGKIAIPAEILSKPNKLLDLEFSLIKTHVTVGYEIIKQIQFPWPVDTYLLQHHERNDGSGYPNGTKKEDILLGSAILIVADVVEAISSHRPYRPALGIDFAISEISKNKGTLFDADVVDACLAVLQNENFSF
ncbi:MAG: HD domain-containing protein [Spirochaetia bacterium]|nr:HD domain-containing protein [Spirochaetia bacterium]